jgi:hypothetical protein
MSVVVLRRATRQPFLAATVLAVNLLILLALQYDGHTLWHKVYQFVPGANAIRDVARFMIVAALPMSIVFAVAVEHAERRAQGRRQLLAMLVALIAFGLVEQFNLEQGQSYSIHRETEWLHTLAARLPGGCSAFYVVGHAASDSVLNSYHNRQWMHDAMLVSALRDVPTLNGRSSKSPPGWQLREVTAPEYELRVREWIERHRLSGKICRLQMDP